MASVLSLRQLDTLLRQARPLRGRTHGVAALQTARPSGPGPRTQADHRLGEPPRSGTAGRNHRVQAHCACHPVKNVGKPCEGEPHLMGGSWKRSGYQAMATEKNNPTGNRAGPNGSVTYRRTMPPRQLSTLLRYGHSARRFSKI